MGDLDDGEVIQVVSASVLRATTKKVVNFFGEKSAPQTERRKEGKI